MTQEIPGTSPETNDNQPVVAIAGERVIASMPLDILQAPMDINDQHAVRRIEGVDGKSEVRFVVGHGRLEEDGTPVDIVQTGRELPSGKPELQILPRLVNEQGSAGETDPQLTHVPEEVRRAFGAAGLLRGVAEKLKGRFIQDRIREHPLSGGKFQTRAVTRVSQNPHLKTMTTIDPDNPEAPQHRIVINTYDQDVENH